MHWSNSLLYYIIFFDNIGLQMKLKILLILPVILISCSLCAFSPAPQEPTPTYDPFSEGTFYTDPAPAAEDPEARFDEMILVPEGPFIMGTDSEDAFADTKPSHRVTLKAYLIDRYEVTNAQYTKCVEAKYCTPPQDLSSATRPDYFTNNDYANFPVIHVDWYQASAYCSWAGKRLPTEAEWEKAARGEQGYFFPWGNSLPEVIPAQINQFEGGDTAPADANPEGISPYGVYNMEGNVWEWTADQYDQYYYSKSPAADPRAVTGGNDYVIRGFSWAYPFDRYEITTRNFSYILKHTYDLGFRCAKDN